MKRLGLRLLHDDKGSTLVEMTIVLPLLLLLTFGLVEFGSLLWRYNAAEKATAAGARYLATRGPLATGMPDCFVSTAADSGTACSQIPEWPAPLAYSKTCIAGGSGCDATVMNNLVATMQAYAPFIAASNVSVVLHGSGMGYVGRGSPVPLITVRTTGLSYDFVTLNSLLGFGPIAMPSFATTLVGEDQKEGAGP